MNESNCYSLNLHQGLQTSSILVVFENFFEQMEVIRKILFRYIPFRFFELLVKRYFDKVEHVVNDKCWLENLSKFQNIQNWSFCICEHLFTTKGKEI